MPNVGDWARMAREILPSASIHCFEILGSTARELAERVSGMPQVYVNDFGLWHEAGTVRLSRYDGFSTLTNVFEHPHPFETSVAEGKVAPGISTPRSTASRPSISSRWTWRVPNRTC